MKNRCALIIIITSLCHRTAVELRKMICTDLRKDLHTVYVYIGLMKILFASLAKEISTGNISFLGGGGGGGGACVLVLFQIARKKQCMILSSCSISESPVCAS